jgi:hypothetical protein
LNTPKNEIEQFIYTVCYQSIWEAVYRHIYQHPYTLDLSHSRIKYPDSAVLEDMIVEFTRNINIDEDTLNFDVIVSCTIDLTADGTFGVANHDISQWFILSCSATITNKLESLIVLSIAPFKFLKHLATNGIAVEKNIIPILYKKDLDNEASSFLKKYYPEALEQPLPVPIKKIAENLGLEIIQGHCITDNFSIFGQICFSEGTINVYDLFKCTNYDIPVKRGSIIIDASTFYERNLGCVNNTIAHEIYHWYRHRIYVSIKQIIHKKKVIACRCPTDTAYPQKFETWSDEQQMEWQANKLAPRILMPLKTFCIKVNELYKLNGYSSLTITAEELIILATELSTFYSVSRQSVLIRMLETGFKEAALALQPIDTRTTHSLVDLHGAFSEYRNNSELKELVNNNLFKYVAGYFVINDSRYIEISPSGKPSLTDYALSNMQECTLQFSWQLSEQQRFHEQHSTDILYRAKEIPQESKFTSKNNVAVINLSEKLQQKRIEFERQNAEYKLSATNKSCWQLIYEIIQARGLSKSHFCTLTDLDDINYRRAEKNERTKPAFRTIVTIACGLNLGINTTETLLMLAGHAFDESDEHQALKFCVTSLMGSSIEEKNAFLASYGYEPLGSKQRK